MSMRVRSGLYGYGMYGKPMTALGPRIPNQIVAQRDTGFLGIGKAIKRASRSVKRAAKKASRTVKRTARAASRGVKRATRPLGRTALGRTFNKATRYASRGVKKFGPTALRLTATGASFVPGIGSGVASGLGAAAALSEGKSWRDIAQEAALSSLPGGAAAQMAAGTGLRVLRGQRLDRAALAAAQKHIPGGELGRAGFRAGLAVARGKPVGRTLSRAARAAAAGAARSALSRAAPLALPSVVRRQPLMSTRITAHLRSADPLRGQRFKAFGRPPGLGRVSSRLAEQAIRRHPGLATKSTRSLARSLGISSNAALLARSRARALRWRPLRGKAPAWIAKMSRGFPSRYLSRRDTTGLAPDGATWTIEKGDTLYAIAKKLTGDGNRWREFLKANPTVKRHSKWGLEVYPGDVLVIPPPWVPEAAPPIDEVTGAEVLKSKAILKAWTLTDGADQPGPTGYGTRPEDVSTEWGPRDTMLLASFARWRGGLPTDGELTQPLVDALALWAEQRAGVPTHRPLPMPPAQRPLPPEMPSPPPEPPPALPPPTAPTPRQTRPSRPALPGSPGSSGPVIVRPTPPARPPSLPGPQPTTPALPPPPIPPTIPSVSPITAPKKSSGAGLFAAALAAAAFLL